MTKLVLFAEGGFGRDVAHRIASENASAASYSLARSSGQFELLLHGADFAGVAAWRRYTRECDELDAVCSRLRIPWTSAVLEGAELRSGPLIVPGGPCFACYQRRRMTHVQDIEREITIDKACGADPALGPAGFLPSASAMAVAGMRLDWQDRSFAAGRIRQADLLTGGFLETRVVRVHGCARCSSTRAGERYVRRLVPAVREILG
jgi:bacteriocin biosynthesis cyclodehydratase domain-containing protein